MEKEAEEKEQVEELERKWEEREEPKRWRVGKGGGEEQGMGGRDGEEGAGDWESGGEVNGYGVKGSVG